MEASPLPPIPAAKDVAAARRRRAQRTFILLLVGATLAISFAWWLDRVSSVPFANITSLGHSIANEISAEFSSYPEPLTAFTNLSKAKAILTRSGVITDTNQQRAANGFPPLAEDATLDDVALLRLDDMFTKQYFAHVSPTGASAETVASSVGYNHLALGENLAEGIFAGDAGVVTAWMNSPGHRANILNTHYDQIGVAVREGAFQGRNVWIAVQVLGRPSSDCPAPDVTLKASIDAAEAQLTAMTAQLKSQKADIDATQPQSGSDYNAKVEQYNNLVGQYNALSVQAKIEVGQYNSEVSAFNQCLAG